MSKQKLPCSLISNGISSIPICGNCPGPSLLDHLRLMVQYLGTSKDDVKQVRTNEVTVRLLCFLCTVDTSKRHILEILPGFQAFLNVDDI